jgi:hypothetical protein
MASDMRAFPAPPTAMLIIKCGACGGDVSSAATACPKCGHPVPKNPLTQNVGCGSVIILGILGVVFYNIVSGPSTYQPMPTTPDPPQPPAQVVHDARVDAAEMCMIAIKKYLNDPESAEFPLASSPEMIVLTETNDNYTVQFIGRVKNPFGALIRKPFECKVHHNVQAKTFLAIPTRMQPKSQ